MKFEPFVNIFKDATSNYTKVKKEDYKSNGAFPIVDQGQTFVGGYTDDENLITKATKPVIVFGDHTKIFKYVDFPFTIGADGVKVLTLKNADYNSLYFYYYLKSIKIVDKGYSRHFKYLKEKKIPVPDIISDQIQIANILSKAENLIAQRKQSIALLDEFLKSSFNDMFGNPVTNVKKFRIEKLSEFISFLTSGGRGWNKYYSESGDRFIRSFDVQMNSISNEDAVFVKPPNNQEAKRTQVKSNDVLLTVTGSKIGRAVMIPSNFGIGYVSQHVAIIRTKNILPLYLSYYLADTNCGQYLIGKNQYGQTKPGLNFKQIENFEIISPPIELQKKFAALVEKTEAQKVKCKNSLQELENLYDCLSQKAFKGELEFNKHQAAAN